MQNATPQQHSQTLQSAALVDVLEHERRKIGRKEKWSAGWQESFKAEMDEQLDAAKHWC